MAFLIWPGENVSCMVNSPWPAEWPQPALHLIPKWHVWGTDWQV